MKNIRHCLCLLAYALLGLLTLSCIDDSYNAGPGGSSTFEGGPTERAEKKAGRIALGYCTYYGTLTPDPAVLTHINYAFAELYIRDGKYQSFKLQGDEKRFQQIVSVKKKFPELKICLSFSHTVANPDNFQNGGFSVMASTDEGRKAFAEDCLAFLKKWGIDGIDIDWEFPGISWSGHACDPAHDVDNFTLLMKQLRETLGNGYLLTYAGYVMNVKGEDGNRRYIDIGAVDRYVDFVNIMTYDLDEAPHHHSALSDSRAYVDCERAVQAYLNAGVKPEKLVLGIPFYGRHSWSKSPTAITYKTILTLDPYKYRRNQWDEVATCPYVATMAGEFFCGYDNPRSIAAKGDWIRRQGMRGLMYWEYDQDDAKGTLRRAVWNAVMTQ